VEVEGRTLALSNLDKVLYPAAGFTKAAVIDYYTRVAPVLLPHLKGRALTLKRYPNGVEKPFFYEKNCPSHRPPWVRTCAIPAGRDGAVIDYCLADDLPTLVWLANLADLEMHASLAPGAEPGRPRVVAFDFDPGAPAALAECCRVALWLRELLAGLGLRCFPKTSGSKGMQVYVPLNCAISYEETRPFALAVARLLEEGHPRQVVSRMAKAERRGRVFIDWSQNERSKTTVCAYSLRATAHPRVSTPLEWEEVERCAESLDAEALQFGPEALLARVEAAGDLFAPVNELEQRLPAV